MGLTVLDAGMVIALLDATDSHHHAALTAMRASRDRADDLVLPVSAYAEVLVAPFRSGAEAAGIVDAFVDALPAAVAPITRAIASRAAQLRARQRSVRLPDALVIATALELRADRLLTTDRRWRDVGVTVDVI